MFIVILFIFLGIALGYTLRTRLASKVGAISALNGRFTTWLIWLLLFMLGLEVGHHAAHHHADRWSALRCTQYIPRLRHRLHRAVLRHHVVYAGLIV